MGRSAAAAQALCTAALWAVLAPGCAAAAEPQGSLEPLPGQFQAFMRRYAKAYTAEEWQPRFEAFKSTVAFIHEENAKNHSFTLGLNQFADLSPNEWKDRFPTTNISVSSFARMAIGTSRAAVSSAGKCDWKKAMPPVLNQGSCGSCWAFATTAVISGAWWILNNGRYPPEELSLQQFMDCSTAQGNHGCHGGTIESAFRFFFYHDLCSAASYPYTGVLGQCRSSCQVRIPSDSVSGAWRLPPGDEPALMATVCKQPVAARMHAGSVYLKSYRSGVLGGSRPLCLEGEVPNHAVVIVGWGTWQQTDYWSIRNSWGPEWGMGGYFNLARGVGLRALGDCDILSDSLYPDMHLPRAALTEPAASKFAGPPQPAGGKAGGPAQARAPQAVAPATAGGSSGAAHEARGEEFFP